MGFVRQGLGILALIGALGMAGLALAAPGDKLSDKGKIDQTPAVTADFGDDASQYANDGECDDIRFSGPGSAKRPSGVDRGHDATDCSAALAAGSVAFNGEPILPEIEFGDDTSSYANNEECDDPRFQGSTGMADVLVAGDIMHDATDCRTLVESGSITVIPVYTASYAAGAPYDASGITFGNDTSGYANNSACDDPRFIGPGLASATLDEDLLHDAADCQAAFVAGTVVLKADAEANPDIDFNVYTSTVDPSIDFGENSSEYKNDGECDDPRFEGIGVDEVLNDADRMKDAKDCSELFDAGEITLLPVFGPDYVSGAPYDSSAIEFGDNTSDYSDNGECDDPRFIGPTMAVDPARRRHPARLGRLQDRLRGRHGRPQGRGGSPAGDRHDGLHLGQRSLDRFRRQHQRLQGQRRVRRSAVCG